jgi:hypothetical protein
MKYRHGDFEHDVHVVRWGSQTKFARNGAVDTVTRSAVLRGAVVGANEAELKAACLALEQAYLYTPVAKSGLAHADGGDSAHVFYAAQSEFGIRVARFDWVDGPAEYVRKRSYEITVEVSLMPAGYVVELEFSDRLEQLGFGGERKIARPVLTGLPVIQTVYQNTPFRYRHSGSATGRGDFPAVPPPALPVEYLLQDESGTSRSVTSKGGATRYSVTWNYQFLSATRLL